MTHLIPLPLPGLEISATGARPTDLDAIDADQVTDACGLLGRVDDQARWLLGDLALALTNRVGDAEANRRLSAQGHHQPTLAAAVNVCAAVPHAIRRPGLSWSHHVEVARMDRPAMAVWLERAETEGWSVRDLRAAIHAEHESRRPALPGTERLPRPPESLLRTALSEHPTDPVIWSPSGGSLASAQVRNVVVKGDRAVVVLEVDAAIANMLGVQESRGAA